MKSFRSEGREFKLLKVRDLHFRVIYVSVKTEVEIMHFIYARKIMRHWKSTHSLYVQLSI